MKPTPKYKAGQEAPDFTIDDANGEPFRLSDFRGRKSVALVFLRYAGCPLCQLAIGQLKNKYGEFSSRNAELAVFVQSPRESLLEYGDVSVFPFRLIPDPDERVYKLFGVGGGNIMSLIHPQVAVLGVKALLNGDKQGKMEGNQWQLPGDFVVGLDGVLRLARVGSHFGDNLPPDELIANL